jgi:hypothetical protein
MSKKRATKSKKNVWFIRVRGSYLPASLQGWLTYVVFLSYVVITAIITFDINTSVWYQALATFSLWVTGAVILTFVAESSS